MRKRLLVAAGTMAGLAGVGLVVLAMLPPAPGVTKLNFDRIEIGMTEADIEALLGRRAEKSELGLAKHGLLEFAWWHGDDKAMVTITLHNGFVDEKRWAAPTETISEKIRRWLRL